MFGIPFSVTQEVLINRPVKDVFEAITNFEVWKKWSPWLHMEPTVKIKTENPWGVMGHSQSWDGDLIGSGRMTLGTLEMNRKVVCELEFFKPWKSKSQATFLLTAEGEKTLVRWEMNSKLPFFMFFFKKMMKAFVTNDFRRGLSMLKEYMESGTVLSKSEIMATEKKPGFYYVGLTHEASISEMATLSKQDFTQLGSMVRDGVIASPAFMLTFYRKFDMIHGRCLFTSALAFKNEADAKKATAEIDPSKVKSSYVDEHKGFQVMHTGAYHHLGNAWTTAMSAQRHSKLKTDKNVDMYEVYVNTPMNASVEDLKTQIVIPVR